MTLSRRNAIRISGATMIGLSLGRVAPAVGAEMTSAPRTRSNRRGARAEAATRDTLSRQLARFVLTTKFDDLPKPIVEAWKTIVLDSFGIGFVGSKDRLARATNEVARKLGGAPECTVINQTYRIDPSRAAWVNGTMIGTPQSDSSSSIHASSNTVPAIMAIAERHHLDGKAFLAALILGGEVGGRISAASIGVERDRGFHNPGVQGVFSAAAAVGRLLNFDENTMVHALGIAGSSAAGLQEFAFEGSDQKATHAGRSAQLGLESALLAAAGVLGPSTVLEGPFGYFNAFSLPTDPKKVVENLNVSALRPPAHKPYGAHGSHQQIVDTILRFKAATPGFKPENVRRVIVRGPESSLHERHVVLEPTTIMGAKYSLPFTTAVTVFRDISDPLNYDDAAIHDTKIRELAKHVELVPADNAGDRANGGNVEITLEMTDGQRHVLPSRAFKGSLRNPYTFEDGVAKFRQWTHRIIGEKQSAELIEGVRGLTQISDMAVLVRATAARGA